MLHLRDPFLVEISGNKGQFSLKLHRGTKVSASAVSFHFHVMHELNQFCHCQFVNVVKSVIAGFVDCGFLNFNR